MQQTELLEEHKAFVIQSLNLNIIHDWLPVIGEGGLCSLDINDILLPRLRLTLTFEHGNFLNSFAFKGKI